jgi:hypothetical protein
MSCSPAWLKLNIRLHKPSRYAIAGKANASLLKPQPIHKIFQIPFFIRDEEIFRVSAWGRVGERHAGESEEDSDYRVIWFFFLHLEHDLLE